MTLLTPTVTISPRGEERLRSGHPWIYRSDVKTVAASGGDRVIVQRSRGRPPGTAFFSDRSQSALRMLTRGDVTAADVLVQNHIADATAYTRCPRLDAS